MVALNPNQELHPNLVPTLGLFCKIGTTVLGNEMKSSIFDLKTRAVTAVAQEAFEGKKLDEFLMMLRSFKSHSKIEIGRSMRTLKGEFENALYKANDFYSGRSKRPDKFFYPRLDTYLNDTNKIIDSYFITFAHILREHQLVTNAHETEEYHHSVSHAFDDLGIQIQENIFCIKPKTSKN